jgi:hypothetical protein
MAVSFEAAIFVLTDDAFVRWHEIDRRQSTCLTLSCQLMAVLMLPL